MTQVKRNVLLVSISAVSLILSLTGVFREVLPFDVAWIAILLCGVPILFGCAGALIRDHDIKADLLVSIALVASVAIGEYFAAGEVAVIMALGTILEDTTAARAQKSIERLIELTPVTARIRTQDGDKVVPVEEVKAGDRLLVLAGETIPVDGKILSGYTTIDQSAMTGESVPADKEPGDSVISGTVNQYGAFEMMALKTGEDSSLQRMVRLSSEADADQAPVVRTADRWATWLVAAAMAAAVLTGLITGDVSRAVTILVVFCPCAFILATPTAVMAGMGNAARCGILVRSGEALQKLADVRAVAFDKTGTLTAGKPEMSTIKSFLPEYPEEELLRLTAGAELLSEHPLGKAIVRSCNARGIQVPASDEFQMHPGKGISAAVEGQKICAGSWKWMEELQPASSDSAEQMIRESEHPGASWIYISINGKLAGTAVLADCLREEACSMVSALAEEGIHSILLTGDHSAAAEEIARKAGISEVHAEQLPEDKMQLIRTYSEQGKKICMVGDGVNDALALRTADAGIAMGGVGSDIAVEAADAVLAGDCIERIPYLFWMAKKTMKRITANIAFAMSWNTAAVVLSAMGILNPVAAALVHNVGSVFVVVSSALLLTCRFQTADRRKDK